MENLLEETLKTIKSMGKTPDDILFVTDGIVSESWNDFSVRAKEINYDSGYGSNEIIKELKVVGDGWWLERWEYDGSEGWNWRKYPVKEKPKGQVKILSD